MTSIQDNSRKLNNARKKISVRS